MLYELLDRAAHGDFPSPDASLRVMAPVAGAPEAILAFSAAHVVATSLPEPVIRARIPAKDLNAPLSAEVLTWFGEQVGRRCDNIDAVLAAVSTDVDCDVELVTVDPSYPHPRVAQARRHRDDLRVFRDRGGRAVVVLGRGLAGRWEVSLEIDRGHRGSGLGGAVAHAARCVAPAGLPLFAQVAPGNASSLRAFLTAGFRPIGAEALFF